MCHGMRVNQVDHAYAFMVMEGHRRVTAAAVVGGLFAMVTEGAQLCKNTTLIIGKLKTESTERNSEIDMLLGSCPFLS